MVLIILTDHDFVQYSATLLLENVELYSKFHLVVNLGAHFCVTVLAGYYMIVACTRCSNGHLPHISRQSVVKN